MKCRKVKQKLVAYLDGELQERQKLLIEEHLSKCAQCKREADLLNKTFYLLKNQEHLKPSEDFEANLWKRVHSAEKRELLPQNIFGRLAHLSLPAAVAAALIIGVIVGNFMEKRVPSQNANLEEECLTSIGLDSFENLPPGSLPEIYFNLATTKEVENG
ncbi:MAG: zf-HC2 domain-containing protein [Candidatus Aerophobetes bacterium]|nr:zf-HC2 domain-containing protein [Candidatus Aerophobetes bacterium]